MELLLYMGLLAIFLTILTQIFVAALDVQLESESTSSLEQNGRYIISRLRYDIARSSEITQPANLGETTQQLQLTINSAPVTYSLAGQNLQISSGESLDQLNSNDTTVSNLEITRNGNALGKPTLTVSFLLTSLIERGKGRDTKTYQATIGTR